MPRTITCSKLKLEAEGLSKPPFPGALGEKIYNEISKKAWEEWLSHQTMLINEYHLNLLEAKARDFIKEELHKFLFGEGSNKPAGYNEKK